MKRVALIVVVVALLGGGVYWMYERGQGRDIPSSPPAGAPKAGTCYKVDADGVKAALPWVGDPVDCAGAHTVELFYVGQVGKDLLHRLDDAKGDDVKITQALLYAQARRACLVQGPLFLAGGWHEARVQIVASWVKPATDGFFGCGVAEVTGPTGDQFAAHEGTLKGALAQDSPLAIACVQRSGDLLRYVGCSETHDGEYSGVYTITPPEAPFDEAAVKSATAKGCTTVGLKYLGLPENGSREDLAPGSAGPKTASDWLGSDQAFACYLMSPKPLKATVRGIGSAPLPLA
ncbi:septum formation family protein [Dactylosporangium sp. NPDC048998]|uniref:septum formation family protein n=1 Tax=Dactylosporangium sp. NPDC048998 TaxID=3363976 RepID=UPI00371D8C4C